MDNLLLIIEKWLPLTLSLIATLTAVIMPYLLKQREIKHSIQIKRYELMFKSKLEAYTKLFEYFSIFQNKSLLRKIENNEDAYSFYIEKIEKLLNNDNFLTSILLLSNSGVMAEIVNLVHALRNCIDSTSDISKLEKSMNSCFLKIARILRKDLYSLEKQ